MASILEAQIDFLGEQVHSLPADARNAEQIEEAVAVSLSLFDRILAAASADLSKRSAGATMFAHWLRSAETILPSVRELKKRGERLPLTEPFVRAMLRARAAAGHASPAGTTESWIALDEVERDLQRGTD